MGSSLAELQKSGVFTAKLPPDPAFETPESSHQAPRETLGPRLVKGALYTFVRPEPTKATELLGVSPKAMMDLGLKPGEEHTPEFEALVSGNSINWTEESGGIYPWAQCYGVVHGQASWAMGLFECTNPDTHIRYELQLKGAGRTPYSRFADGKAVVRSSIREYVVSEALSALGVPTTRALSITLLPQSKVLRERIEPGAIVARFAESWLRIGTFDLPHARGDRDTVRKLATFAAEEVFHGWEALPAIVSLGKDHPPDAVENPARDVPWDQIQHHQGVEENRFARLYREIARRNAKTVAAWQAYGFMNGVLNTDNTSIYGELMGAGDKVDDPSFVKEGLAEESMPAVVERAEAIIERTSDEFRTVFLNEYKHLMGKRLGLKSRKESDFQHLFSELLDTLEALELDFNHFFRRLSHIPLTAIETEDQRKDTAPVFFHEEGFGGIGYTDETAKERIGNWLDSWRARILEDWGPDEDQQRQEAMKAVNPKFLPRGWVLDEVIERVERRGDRVILEQVMRMALNPCEDTWGLDKKLEERFCGDVPRFQRAMMCSCSS
ncbi:hypothetical protein N8T08_006072 [Aspergillus melleus]|uniref:Uncharacterized protein n=1 Tax=Aspergillus melleus TaxID=138277 RepID=A0ACC3B0J5_9EURO|nr:hypothetical protein N8T08_006072 [Aspergillus melleus]